MAKTTECEYRLSEIKQVLEHPHNKVKLGPSIMQLIDKNEIYTTRKKAKQEAIPQVITENMLDDEV